MSTTASSILIRCAEALHDPDSTRWKVQELVRYLNDGQSEVAVQRPDAASVYGPIALVAGARQALPAGATKLIDVVRNTNGNAVRKVSRDILDAQAPDWYRMTGVTDIRHFSYDLREPKVFYVYPPAATTGASVDAVYGVLPTGIAEPAAGTTVAQVTGNIGVSDIYANALRDYVLYRAHTKDFESAIPERAVAHYNAFTNALTREMQATVAVAPTQE